MASVTLIGTLLAKPGTEFLYRGPLNDCRNCKLKTVCFNLKPGRMYTITNVREKHHDCHIHEEDVVVVEVAEQPIITAISSDEKPAETIEGEKISCSHIGCDFYEVCTNPAIQQGKIFTVKKNLGNISCLCKRELYQVELSDQ